MRPKWHRKSWKKPASISDQSESPSSMPRMRERERSDEKKQKINNLNAYIDIHATCDDRNMRFIPPHIQPDENSHFIFVINARAYAQICVVNCKWTNIAISNFSQLTDDQFRTEKTKPTTEKNVEQQRNAIERLALRIISHIKIIFTKCHRTHVHINYWFFMSSKRRNFLHFSPSNIRFCFSTNK